MSSSSSHTSAPSHKTSSKSRNRGLGSFRKSLTKPVRIKLFSNSVSTTSTANTALEVASNIALNGTEFPELVDFSAVYDEIRVLRVTMHYCLDTLTPSSSAAGVFGGVAIGFDPNLSAPTSISNICTPAFSSGPLFIACSYNTTTTSVYDKQKLPKLSAVVPAALAPITTSDCPGNAWVTLDTSTAATACQVQAYVQPLGTSGVSSFTYMLEFDCELKVRV